jgi:class 3 adenylate cyclase
MQIQASTKGFYWIVAAATGIGIIVVTVLNVATPSEFVLTHFYDSLKSDKFILGIQLIARLFGLIILILTICAPLMVVVRLILTPINIVLNIFRKGEEPTTVQKESACRRLLNLPFLFVPINIVMWMLIPIAIFIPGYLMNLYDFHATVILSIRASMVGLISSAIASFWIESYSRRRFIPLFFPKNNLSGLRGAAHLSISRRIRLLYRLGSMVPMTILLITLLTLQWEVDSAAITARDYGKGILSFTVVLIIVFFILAGVLNKLVSRSIANPLKNVLNIIPKIQEGEFTARIQVISNDEIGQLGEAGNAMIKGLEEREMLRTALGKYVTPEIRDEILSGRIPLDGELKEVTVLFADLRNFTPLAEANEPKVVVKIINAYFTEMASSIQEHSGLVIQFIGDEIEAVFGAPLPLEKHPMKAVEAALEMRLRLNLVNDRLKMEGHTPLRHGIGIHTGQVVAANIGSPDRHSYALVGDTVNLASRIQELNKQANTDILISETTRSHLDREIPIKRLPTIKVKGKIEPISVYKII